MDFNQHLIIEEQLPKFWLTQAQTAEPYHHAMFPLIFSDFSFVLYENSDLKSYLYGAHSQTHGFIHIIATKHGNYRKGYATHILNHWEAAARKKNLQKALAFSLEINTLSQKFFEKNGYTPKQTLQVWSNSYRILFEKTL